MTGTGICKLLWVDGYGEIGGTMKARIMVVTGFAMMAGACSNGFETGEPADYEGTDPLLFAMADPEAIANARCGDKKVLICHVPPGNPAAKHTICIGEPAVTAHLEKHHGGRSLDYLGDCAQTPGATPVPTPEPPVIDPTPVPNPDPTTAPTPVPNPDPTAAPTPMPSPNPDPGGGTDPTPAPSPEPTVVPQPTASPEPVPTPGPDNF